MSTDTLTDRDRLAMNLDAEADRIETFGRWADSHSAEVETTADASGSVTIRSDDGGDSASLWVTIEGAEVMTYVDIESVLRNDAPDTECDDLGDFERIAETMREAAALLKTEHTAPATLPASIAAARVQCADLIRAVPVSPTVAALMSATLAALDAAAAANAAAVAMITHGPAEHLATGDEVSGDPFDRAEEEAPPFDPPASGDRI